jgi:cell fate (sporulation/competence/biofilm development) regulator YlbF (YheA/YmcA/DUF963 family)
MITRQLINEISALKHEIIMLQSLSQLIHDSIELSAILEGVPSVIVSQDIANRLWEVSNQLANLEKSLEAQWEVAA